MTVSGRLGAAAKQVIQLVNTAISPEDGTVIGGGAGIQAFQIATGSRCMSRTAIRGSLN